MGVFGPVSAEISGNRALSIAAPETTDMGFVTKLILKLSHVDYPIICQIE